MLFLESVHPVDLFMGRLDRGDDLLEQITQICRQKRIHLGTVEGLGAVEKAVIGYFDQEKREYLYRTFDEPLEIAALTGNISLKEGEPFVHAHITLADRKGNCYGGHLAEGTRVFACEFVLQSFGGPELIRVPDDKTNLSLWQNQAT